MEAIVKNNGINSSDHKPIKEFKVFFRVYDNFEGWFESFESFESMRVMRDEVLRV